MGGPSLPNVQDYMWFVPTTFTLSYQNGPLNGRTRVFPGFHRLAYQSGAWALDPNGPYLAADATGWGVADSALQPVGIPPTDGTERSSGVRIVDNAATLNGNRHWRHGI